MCSWSHFRPHYSGCPFPSPHLKGVGLRSSRPCPSARFKCSTRLHRRHGGSLGKAIQEGVPRLHRGPKAKPPRPTDWKCLRDCHLPAIDSDERRLRPLNHELWFTADPVANYEEHKSLVNIETNKQISSIGEGNDWLIGMAAVDSKLVQTSSDWNLQSYPTPVVLLSETITVL